MLKKQNKEVNIPAMTVKRARVAIVRSEYNEDISKSLEENCLKVLIDKGLRRENIKVFRVPGALEIPVVAQKIARRRLADAIIALGAIVKGETYHFDLIANETARGCMDISLQFNIPVIFEVLVVYDLKQAKERSGNNDNNKGREAAITALKMINIMGKIK